VALLVSYESFDINSINLYWYQAYGTDSSLEKNSNVIFDGQTYPDFYWVDGYDGYNYLELDVLGTGINQDFNGNIVSGIINVIGEFDINANSTLWFAEGLSVSAAAVYNAALTSSNQDEISLVQVALAGDDTIILSPFADRMSGYSGNDTITGGGGSDILAGGGGNDTFLDTAACLNGDTITDFGFGDRIVISDANFSTFSLSLNGNTLAYSGGTVFFGNGFLGTMVIRPAAGGGVELTVKPASVANDFNGDHRSDILWRDDSGHVTDWLGTSAGGFAQNGANAFASVGVDWHVAGIGDFNADGRQDILWRNDNGAITNWIANANGNAGFAASTTFSTTVSNAWHVVGVGDFNADGRDDILWRNDDGTITDWLSNANGTFSASTTFSTYVPTDWHVVGTGDFNGDGRDDILWRNDNGQLTDWLRTADGSFLANVFSVYVPTDWSVAATGDFNGDGYTDVLWRQDTGQLTDWLGSPSGALVDNGANASIFVPANWQVVSVGDFNGDARDDILWRDANGQLTEWLGTSNGGFTDNSASASTFVPTNWHVVAQDGGLH